MTAIHVQESASVENIPVSVSIVGEAVGVTSETVRAFSVRDGSERVRVSAKATATGAAYPVSAGTVTPIIPDPYTGEYEVTPSEETQTLLTVGKNMTRNVTVHPIPSNYGMITWNGSVLTVS